MLKFLQIPRKRTALASLIFFIIFIYYLDNYIGKESYDFMESTKVNAVKTKRTLQYSLVHEGITASSANMYITRKNYTHRPVPNYYVDKGVEDLQWQLTTYYIAGELARRYHARYIIDIGCGSGVKLSSFRDEFHLIGIDYKTNAENASKNFPFMEVIEADLDKNANCNVDIISKEVLEQAVIVSADVIEHLVDPLACYVKLLKRFSEHSFAMVISTPDAARLFCISGPQINTIMGPPCNHAHVREWYDYELEILFLDQGLHTMYDGHSCGHMASCVESYWPNSSHLTNQIHIVGNSEVRRSWLEDPETDTQVIAFVIRHKETNDALVDFNVNYLRNQGIQVHVINVFEGGTMQQQSTNQLFAKSEEEAFHMIQHIAAESHYKDGDWFLIIDAHEILTLPQSPALNLTLKESLLRIGLEPYGFNAVATTTFFMHDKNAQPFEPKIPFKVFSLASWDEGPGEHDRLWPTVDTLKHRIKIWQKQKDPVGIATLDTDIGTKAITHVSFMGQNVYPFHCQSLRFHPRSGSPYIWLNDDLRRLFILDIAVGYTLKGRENLYTSTYLY